MLVKHQLSNDMRCGNPLYSCSYICHLQKLSNYEAECRHKVADSEQRLRQHRDRTIALLAEKDQELELLRDRLHIGGGSAGVSATSDHDSQQVSVQADAQTINPKKI